MVRVLEFVSGNADRNADKEHTRLATPPHPPNALPRNTAAGPSRTLATRNVSPIWCSYQHRLKPAGDVRLQIISRPHRMWCVLSDISQI